MKWRWKENNMETENYEEIVTPFKDIKNGKYSYTVARVVEDNKCAELHYDNGKTTIEYMTQINPGEWEGEVEIVDWFNLNLKEDYVLVKLNHLYDERYLNKKLTDIQYDEVTLIQNILYNHKIEDMEVYIDSNNELVAIDDENYWKGIEIYDFLFDELFVINENGTIDLVSNKELIDLKKYRQKYAIESIKNYRKIYEEISKIPRFDWNNFEFYIGIYHANSNISSEDAIRIIDVCNNCASDYINSRTLAFELTTAIYDEKCINLDDLENVPPAEIQEMYDQAKMYRLEQYSSHNKEIDNEEYEK